MRLRLGNIVLAALLLVCSAGCGMRGRVIPPQTMSQIYADMFIADQWLIDNSGARAKADTSDFYGPIFAKYGYSFKDYNKSVHHYLNSPKKFNDILEGSNTILSNALDALKDEQTIREQIEEQQKYLRKYALAKVDFKRDTLLWKPDSLRAKPLKQITIKDTLDVKRGDSIRTNILPTARKFLGDKPLTLKGKDL